MSHKTKPFTTVVVEESWMEQAGTNIGPALHLAVPLATAKHEGAKIEIVASANTAEFVINVKQPRKKMRQFIVDPTKLIEAVMKKLAEEA